jgi:hypothetical protein
LEQIVKRAHATIERMERLAEQAKKLSADAKRCLQAIDARLVKGKDEKR